MVYLGFDNILVGYKFTCIAYNWWNNAPHNLRQRSVHKQKTSKTSAIAKTEQNWIKMKVLIKSGFLNIQRSKKYVEMNKLKYMRLNEWTKKTHTMNEKGKCLLETFGWHHFITNVEFLQNVKSIEHAFLRLSDECLENLL